MLGQLALLLLHYALPFSFLFPVCFKYYWKFPGFGYFFPEPWAENKVVFPTEEKYVFV